jgi:hypothetical protein
MTDPSLSPSFQPYRVKPRRDPCGTPLNPPTQRVLVALVDLCPCAAGDVAASDLARRTGVRQGSVVVILRTLVDRGLALRHAGEPEGWAPTMTGRIRARFCAGGRPSEAVDVASREEPRLLDRLAAELDSRG